jgi:hypothetical protein
MAISPSSPPGAQPQHPSKRWWRSKVIGGRSRTVLRPLRMSSDSITTRADAGMAGIATFGDARFRHDGGDTPSRQSETNAELSQHDHRDINPLVNSGSMPHRQQTRPKTNPTCPRHRMVTLAQSSPGDRSACPFQSKPATLMLAPRAPGIVPGLGHQHVPQPMAVVARAAHVLLHPARHELRIEQILRLQPRW